MQRSDVGSAGTVAGIGNWCGRFSWRRLMAQLLALFKRRESVFEDVWFRGARATGFIRSRWHAWQQVFTAGWSSL